jgi:polygalacturonase
MNAYHNILRYGANQDYTNNAPFIQAAVDAASKEGGGTVEIPAGRFRSGSVQLRSNLVLKLSPGAILEGSTDIEDYPPIGFQHNEMGETRSFLWARSAENINIVGPGTIDFKGQAFMFMDVPDDRGPDGDKIALLPEAARAEAVVRAKDRPNQPIFFHECSRLVFRGLHLLDSPCWTITVSCCDTVRMTDVVVKNHLQIPNCDGINISASRNVIVDSCQFTCADDCVAVGSITCWERPSENIVVSNCTMVSRSCGVRIGHLSSNARNILCTNLILSDGNRGIGIFSTDGGVIEDIRIENIILHTRIFPGFWWGKGEPIVINAAEGDGIIRRVTIRGVKGSSENGIILVGRNGNLQNIRLEDIHLEIKPGRYRPTLGKWIDLQPAACRELPEKHIPWLYQDGTKGVVVEKVSFEGETARVAGYKTDAIILDERNLLM